MIAPIIIAVLLSSISLYIQITNKGNPKKENISFILTLIVVVIYISILIWGGFFK